MYRAAGTARKEKKRQKERNKMRDDGIFFIVLFSVYVDFSGYGGLVLRG